MLHEQAAASMPSVKDVIRCDDDYRYVIGRRIDITTWHVKLYTDRLSLPVLRLVLFQGVWRAQYTNLFAKDRISGENEEGLGQQDRSS